MSPDSQTLESILKLKEIFKRYDRRENPLKEIDHPVSSLRRASVLVPLFYKNGELRVLLTKRSNDLTHHAGYVAFPGGMKDDKDKSDIDTALRESEEEIGLSPSDVEVVAVLGPGIVRPNSLVIPVIGIISPDFVPVKNEREVALIFDLPLERFLRDDRLTIRTYRAENSKQLTFHVHHFLDNINGEELDTWGFTASYCVLVALVAFQSEKQFCFVDDVITTKDNAHQGFLNSVVRRWQLKHSL